MNTKVLAGAWRVLLALVFALSAAGISAREARASTYTVWNLGESKAGSLRAAIINANNHPGPDVITFSVSGTITLASSLPDITGPLNIDGTGQNVIISGDDLYRVFYVNSGTTFNLNQLTIVHGNSASNGGAIYNSSSIVIITNSTLRQNHACNFGGAIYTKYGSLNVSNTTFQGNTSVSGGGAVKTYDSTVSFSNTTFFNNIVATGNGGAVYNDLSSSMTISNSTFSRNSAVSGGGIYNDDSLLSVINNTFTGHLVSGSGGALHNDSGTLNLKNTILANSGTASDCFSDVAIGTDTHNLIENNSGCGTPVSTADPKLAALADNGGLTQTHALLPASPAIDKGDDLVCAASPVAGFDQRGASRVYGTHCDIGSYELKKVRLTERSIGSEDGWVLESSETSTTGGTLDSTAATFRLGDDASDRQYRAILSFDTACLQDDAVITRVLLKIRYSTVMGSDPFSILGGLKVDIRMPYFGTSTALVVGDFQAASSLSNVATFNSTPVSNWYTAVIQATGYPFIDPSGTTQFRLRFQTDDNNDNAADYMKFFSGNYATASSRPTLIIEYYVP